jgi:magnesium transporter
VAAAPADRPLAALAGPDPVTVPADAGLVDVAELMAERHLVALPVVDHDGALLGLVTADDVLGVLTRDLRCR